jgi:hypothetical protein
VAGRIRQIEQNLMISSALVPVTFLLVMPIILENGFQGEKVKA